MDACANLAEGEEMIEIAEILYRHDPKFVTLKNEDGWTAVDFLWYNFVDHNNDEV